MRKTMICAIAGMLALWTVPMATASAVPTESETMPPACPPPVTPVLDYLERCWDETAKPTIDSYICHVWSDIIGLPPWTCPTMPEDIFEV